MNKVVRATRHVSSVSPKGQVTLPMEYRKALGVKPRDKVTMVLEGDSIRVQVLDASLAGSFQAVPALPREMDLSTIMAAAREEAARTAVSEGL
jgi:bifunctional DNA-binding transcriptional regulator/antitoxin component of YhaV-PrlF toxin-antitoxin module